MPKLLFFLLFILVQLLFEGGLGSQWTATTAE